MAGLIWGGALVSLVGLSGLLYCIFKVAKAKRSAIDDDALKAVLQSIVPINLGALLLSVLGLILVVIGVFFG
ncbi:hypothetical protein ACMAY7_02130 [Rhodobacteraceae bacterium nBUS_24]|nr:hypothetical protein [Marinovum sp.]MDG2068733.1 hypothetical protein [Paracoccaceae bacterium]